MAGRAARPLTAEERGREALLLGQAQALDERIGRLRDAATLSPEQEKILDDLNRRASEVRRQVLELEQQLEARYGALAGRPAALEAVQQALPEGTALLGWIDTGTDHWACLLRHSGDPVWVRIPGSGADGAWSNEEKGRTLRLRGELDPQTARGDAAPAGRGGGRTTARAAGRCISRGLLRLVVVNSPGLAGVPVEVLLALKPDPAWDGVAVAYAPSASMFAHLLGRPAARGGAPTLLALADPAYPEAEKETSAAGAAGITASPSPASSPMATPTSAASSRRRRPCWPTPGRRAKAPGRPQPAGRGGLERVAVRYWRDGATREAEVAAGLLGVVIDDRPAKAAVQSRRAAERVLLGMRGGARARLPGTRREVEAIARLFPAGAVTTVTGEQACEATVQGLALSGKLKNFRYLHFATHGQDRPRLRLPNRPDPRPRPRRAELRPDCCGKDRRDDHRRADRPHPELDADLVVLSACESGLGQAAAGEGYLGFAQPLFARGARSLVLSQWKVDDDATALLMARFYRNLLGKREGLKAPMPKAEALAEAKRWLRGAGPAEVGAALAALPRGEIVRRQAVKAGPSAHPYEDPIYWAGFVLVGAPD